MSEYEPFLRRFYCVEPCHLVESNCISDTDCMYTDEIKPVLHDCVYTDEMKYVRNF